MIADKEGEYLGEYKVGEDMQYMFSPQEVKGDKKSRFYRVGDDSDEFGTNRNYVKLTPNSNEQKLIDEAI